MDYLLNVRKNGGFSLSPDGVLNLIINGLPSKLVNEYKVLISVI